MARDISTAEEVFTEFVEQESWTKKKQVEILLAFIDEIGAESELQDYLAACVEGDDGGEEPFDQDDE